MSYKVFPHFVIRTPLLPFNLLDSILMDYKKMMQLTSNPLIQEAIYIASADLFSELQKLLKDEINDKKNKTRIIHSLVRYISRMSTRCTPFGLFAGCSIGSISDSTSICFSGTINKTVRLDMQYLGCLYNYLVNDPNVKNKIKYYPNDSIYPIDKKIRYIECLDFNSKKNYKIAEIKNSIYIKSILKKAKKGEFIDNLALSIVSDDISFPEAFAFIEELVNSQVLIGELSSSITGEDYFDRLISLLEKINYDKLALESLKEIRCHLKYITHNIGNIEQYYKLEKQIHKLNINYKEKSFFQVDMIKSTTSATLGENIIKELQQTMEFLNKITTLGENHELISFKNEFYSRYGDKEVPLMDALDPELGLGYPLKSTKLEVSSFLSDFHFNDKKNPSTIYLSAFQNILLKKALASISLNSREIILTDDDIKDFNADWTDLPLTIYSLIEVIQSDPNELLIKANYFGGSSGANLLSRFAHTDDKIKDFIKNIISKENEFNSDAISAEIVHLPESRLGNVLFRPHLRDYELVYMSISDLPSENIIQTSDLLVSIRNEKLHLRSQKKGKEIIPFLTTAHFYQNSSNPVYRFLCDMQTQSKRSSIFFSWGDLEYLLPYLPRIKYNNTILSVATWIVEIKDINYLFQIEDDDLLIKSIEKWREKLLIPTNVLLSDGDNYLYVNWTIPLSIRSLFTIIKKRNTVVFKELIFDHNNNVASDSSNGKYFNECIVVFHKKK